MPFIDTYGFKWKLDKPWLTPAERKLFKKLRASGKVTLFRVNICEGKPDGQRCDQEVPKIQDDKDPSKYLKRFCSEACYQSIQVDQDDEGEDDDADSADDDA